jgi:methylmalonyl-CoA mutase
VGVKIPTREDPLLILDVDNQMVRKQQFKTMDQIKTQEQQKYRSHESLTAQRLEAYWVVDAARNQTTLGEIGDALVLVDIKLN